MKVLLLSFLSSAFVLTLDAQSVVATSGTDLTTNTAIIQISPAIGNTWQIGESQKPIFGITTSAPNAIMTDTVNPYPVNNLSTFDIEYTASVPGNFIGGIGLGFWHFYENDDNADGGFIEISVDSGATFQNVATQTYGMVGMMSNYYTAADTIIGGIPAFNGMMPTWRYCEFQIQFLIALIKPNDDRTSYPFTNKVVIRFNHKSDNVHTSKAGWIIDDIIVKEYDVAGAVINETSPAMQLSTFPNPSGGDLNIQVLSDVKQDISIEVSDLSGKVLIRGSTDPNGQFMIREGTLDSGLYLYRAIDSDGTSRSGKFIIK